MPNKRKVSKKSPLSPLQSLFQLNLQFIKNIDHLEVNDFIDRPDKLLAKQTRMIISNSLLWFEYLRQFWGLFAKMIPETNPSLTDVQRGIPFLESVATALSTATPDVVVGNLTKCLFPPGVDVDLFGLADTMTKSVSTDTTKKTNIKRAH